MSQARLGAVAPSRSARKRTARRLVAVLAVLAGVLASVVVGSAPASAAERQCHRAASTWVTGHTVNTSGRFLTRTYLEKGVLNFWGDEPDSELRGHDGDDWCAGADAFGTAMKVVYAFGGNRVTFEAWRCRPGPAGSRCSLDGPDTARYRCLTKSNANDWSNVVIFTLEPVR